MALSNNYTVYKHTNKLNGKVYIGITKQSVERRWQNGAGYVGSYFGNAIAKYGWENFAHEVLFSGLNKETACKIEIALIKAHKSNLRENGYNISKGGETADVIAPKLGRDNPKSMRVKRINQETGEAVIFDSISDAEREMGINHRGISKACRGVSATYKGYIWEYADRDYNKKPAVGIGNYDHVKQRKRVKMTDASGIEKTYGSIKEAGEDLGIWPNTITRYLLGLRTDSSGRRWTYCP